MAPCLPYLSSPTSTMGSTGLKASLVSFVLLTNCKVWTEWWIRARAN